MLFCGLRLMSAQPLGETRIATEVSKLLQWKVFWEGSQTLAHYQPGMIVNAATVSSTDEIAVFIGEIRITMYLTIENGEISKRVIAGMGMRTTAAAIEKYIRDRKCTPGFVLKPGVSEHADGVPGCSAESSLHGQLISGPRVLRLRLPAATPPAYIIFRTISPKLGELKAAARDRISGYHDLGCGGVTVTIPFFSVSDPTVFVYVDLGKDCGSGIFPFRWGRTGWTSGQFSPNRPPNDWDYTINQVRKYSLLQFSLP